jgi:hypothetical protein
MVDSGGVAATNPSTIKRRIYPLLMADATALASATALSPGTAISVWGASVSALIQHMSDCAFFTIHMQIISPGRNDGTRYLCGHSRGFHTHYVLVDAEDDDGGTKPFLIGLTVGPVPAVCSLATGTSRHPPPCMSLHFVFGIRFTRTESIAPLKKYNDDRNPSVLCSDDIADTSTAFAGSSRYNSSLAINDKYTYVLRLKLYNLKQKANLQKLGNFLLTNFPLFSSHKSSILFTLFTHPPTKIIFLGGRKISIIFLVLHQILESLFPRLDLRYLEYGGFMCVLPFETPIVQEVGLLLRPRDRLFQASLDVGIFASNILTPGLKVGIFGTFRIPSMHVVELFPLLGALLPRKIQVSTLKCKSNRHQEINFVRRQGRIFGTFFDISEIHSLHIAKALKS